MPQRRVRRCVDLIARDLRAERASTPGGRLAKGMLLRSLAAWRRAMAIDTRALRAYYHRRLRRGARLTRNATRAFNRADALERQAREVLRGVGVELG